MSVNYFGPGDSIDYTNPGAAAINGGDVVVLGDQAVIANQDVAVGGAGTGRSRGMFDLPVTDTVGGGIGIGDQLTCTLATGAISNEAIGAGVVFFGYAREAIGAGLNATIRVFKPY